MMRFFSILIVFLFGMPNKNLLLAQNKLQAFDSLKIGLNFVANTNRNIFHEFWEPGKGIEGFVEMPFYYGTVQGGIHFLPYSGKDGTIPNFQTIFVYLEWGNKWILPFKFDWFNGIRIGSYRMEFQEKKLHPKNQNETELTAGVSSRLSYSVREKWVVDLTGNYTTIYTFKRIKLVFLSIGISRSFITPNWLKEFLE